MNFHCIKFLVPVLVLVIPISAEILFTDITQSAGISFSGNAEGVCVFDYNNDGLDDIVIATRGGTNVLLYKNAGNMHFTDVSFESNIGNTSMEARTPIASDYDNDGDLDVFVGAVSGQSHLFKNENGTFQNVTDLSGISIFDQVRGSSWVDYNNDGLLDLYVGLLLETNKFYKNNGDGTFTDIAINVSAAGPMVGGIVMGLGFFDYDRDGDQDLYITQDNNNGNILLRYEYYGAFTNVSIPTNTGIQVMGMGVTFGDINRDGLFDIYTTNLSNNALLLNSYSGVFTDISTASGTDDTPGSMGWGTMFFDVDNDGWIDIYNNNETGFAGIKNSLFINNGDLTFQSIEDESGALLRNNGYGAAYSDFDQDGDIDIILAGRSSTVGSVNLLKNDSDTGNYITLKLSQSDSNIFAIGSTIELHHSGIKQLRHLSSGSSYCSQNTFDVHYGLEDEAEIDSVVIYWPDGWRETFTVLSVNVKNHLIRGQGSEVLGIAREDHNRMEIIGMTIQPNPFNPKTEIIFRVNDINKIAQLFVYDISGKQIIEKNIIAQKSINKISLDLNRYASGLYFVRLIYGGKSHFKKVTLLN